MAAGSDGGAAVRDESRVGRERQSTNGTMWYEVLTKQQTFSCRHCTTVVPWLCLVIFGNWIEREHGNLVIILYLESKLQNQ